MNKLIPDIYYKVEDIDNIKKIWSVLRSTYIGETDDKYQAWLLESKTRDCPISFIYDDKADVFECNTPLACPNKNGVSDEEGLIETLIFYGYPLGDLVPIETLRNNKYQEVYTKYRLSLNGIATMSLPQPMDVDIISELSILGATDPEGLAYIVDKFRNRRQELFILIRDAKTKQAINSIIIDFPM